jgi:type II secretory pathway component GspD/PulD (secretin)
MPVLDSSKARCLTALIAVLTCIIFAVGPALAADEDEEVPPPRPTRPTINRGAGGPPGGPRSTEPPAAPAANTDAEKPSLSVSMSDKGMSVFAVNADAHDVFSKVAAAAGLPLIIDDTVQGNITINIVNKQPKDIIALLVDAYGFSFSEVNKVYVVSEGVPKKPSSYMLGEIEAVTTKYVQPARARSLLPIFLQSDVKMNTDQNSVVLSGPRAVLDKFRRDVEQFDIPAAQIMLDVLVVEYTDVSTDTFSASLGYQNDSFGLTTDSLTGQSVLTAITHLPRDFYANLQALITQRKARVRANPRVATISGLYANVFIGQQRYLTKPVSIPGRGQTNSIDAGVRLNMRPLTGGQGEIILWINQEISTLSALDPATGLPTKTKRTAQTTVRVKDGQTVVIGGLCQSELREKRSRIPIVSEIPIIGRLFQSKRIENTNVELAVFITARVLDEKGHLPAEEETRIRDHFNANGLSTTPSTAAITSPQ